MEAAGWALAPCALSLPRSLLDPARPTRSRSTPLDPARSRLVQLVRLYCKYLGGAIALVPMEGFGTDCYVAFNRLPHENCEQVWTAAICCDLLRSAATCWDLLGFAATCRDLSRSAAICHGLPRFAAICWDLLRPAAICRDLPGAHGCVRWALQLGLRLPHVTTRRSYPLRAACWRAEQMATSSTRSPGVVLPASPESRL